MNIAELQKKLVAVARAEAPQDRVPYAFEKRIMARLKAMPVMDFWAFWGVSLWRAAAPCVAVMLVLGIWSFYSADVNGSDISLENTVLAPVDNPVEVR